MTRKTDSAVEHVLLPNFFVEKAIDCTHIEGIAHGELPFPLGGILGFLLHRNIDGVKLVRNIQIISRVVVMEWVGLGWSFHSLMATSFCTVHQRWRRRACLLRGRQ